VKNTKHYVAVVTASTIWGFFSFVLRPLAGYASLDILFYRVFLSAALLILISAFLRTKVWKADRRSFEALPAAGRRGLVLQILGGGLFLTANWYFFIYVLNHRSIKAASLAYLVCPILTTVLAYFILKERLTRGQWAAVGLSVCGCLLLAMHELTDLLYSIVIALSYAFYLVSQRKDYGTDKFLLLTLQVTVSALLLLVFYPGAHGPVPTSTFFYGLIAIIAVCFTIIPLWLSLYGLKRLKSSTVGIILYINPLMGFVIAVTCYGEKVNLQQAVSYGIIVLSILLFNWWNPRLRGQENDAAGPATAEPGTAPRKVPA
jgi:chloramphenicol-sensitive protein RarD